MSGNATPTKRNMSARSPARKILSPPKPDSPKQGKQLMELVVAAIGALKELRRRITRKAIAEYIKELCRNQYRFENFKDFLNNVGKALKHACKEGKAELVKGKGANAIYGPKK